MNRLRRQTKVLNIQKYFCNGLTLPNILQKYACIKPLGNITDTIKTLKYMHNM